MRDAYLGPSFADDTIEATLKRTSCTLRVLAIPPPTAAELLSQGKILGWFQGRMEFGPRALGSRSILADPRDPEMNTKVNNAVKFREWWRPFAAIAEERSRGATFSKDNGFSVYDLDRSSAPGENGA